MLNDLHPLPGPSHFVVAQGVVGQPSWATTTGSHRASERDRDGDKETEMRRE